MTKVRKAHKSELKDFVAMELDPENSPFVNSDSIKQHVTWHRDPRFVHLSIIFGDELAGFALLRFEEGSTSVELRRIVVSKKGKGIGRRALYLIDEYCLRHGRAAIWLDVLETNSRARHVYEKHGYREFEPAVRDTSEPLVYMKKKLG